MEINFKPSQIIIKIVTHNNDTGAAASGQEQETNGKMVNEHLSNGNQQPINSINLETLANSGSESEVTWNVVNFVVLIGFFL